MTRLSILVVAIGLAIGFAQNVDDAVEDQNQSNEEVRRSSGQQQLASRQGPAHGGALNQGQNSGLPHLLLQCYACQNCPAFSNSSTPTKFCPPTFDTTRNKCVVYTEKYKQMSSAWVIRGCASERGTCADIKAAHDPHSSVLSLVSCNECEGDLCNNGVGKSLPSLAVAVIALLVTPLVATTVFS